MSASRTGERAEDEEIDLTLHDERRASEWSILAPARQPVDEAPGRLRGTVAGVLAGRAGSFGALAVVWVVVCAVVGVLGGGVYGLLNPPQVTARIDVVVASNVSLTGDMTVFDVTDRQVATQQAMLSSPAVAAAASARARTTLAPASVGAAQNSNMLVVSVTEKTEVLARRAVQAYVASYFAMVAAKQKSQLEGSLTSAQDTETSTSAELAQLDAALSAVSSADRSTLLSVQTAQRLALTDERQQALQSEQRIKASLAGLPVNIEQVSDVPDVELSGLSAVTWAMVGLLAGGTVGVLVVLRIAERRRSSPRGA